MLEPEKVSSSRWMGYPMQSPHPCNKLRKEESFNWAISSGNSCRPSVNRWARPSPSSAVLHALLLKEQAVDDRMNAMGSELPIWITTDIYKASKPELPHSEVKKYHMKLCCAGKTYDTWNRPIHFPSQSTLVSGHLCISNVAILNWKLFSRTCAANGLIKALGSNSFLGEFGYILIKKVRKVQKIIKKLIKIALKKT